MGRERREFKRTTGFRDASLLVIATEGEKSEPVYFETLKDSEQFSNPKVHLKIIPSEDGMSSPKYVLSKLNEFKREFRIREDDELWMVVDRDFKSWSQAELSHCLKECKQKKYEIALSNPNFELWVLLHSICVHAESTTFKKELLLNKKENNRTFCERQILKKRGHYNKSNPKFDDLIPKTILAIERAERLTKNNSINLFDELGTDINMLVAKIIKINK